MFQFSFMIGVSQGIENAIGIGKKNDVNMQKSLHSATINTISVNLVYFKATIKAAYYNATIKFTNSNQ